MSKRLLTVAALVFLFAGAAAIAGDRGSGTCTGANCPGNPTCPDADGDGICNGLDPDYVPGSCTANPDCPDADGDGICNGQDEDYLPAGLERWGRKLMQLALGFGA